MLRTIISEGDITTLKDQLATTPGLANQLIVQQTDRPYRVHPIHWLCDVVFEHKIEEATAFEMTRLLVEAGADIDGNIPGTTTEDSLLITASSLYCDSVAIYLLNRGADPNLRGTHQATALHWASWTGSSSVVERLLEEKVNINDQKDEFQSTPLLWAINGWLNPNPRNKREQPKVMELLLAAGANAQLRDGDGKRALDILQDRQETDLIRLLEKFNI